MAETLGLNKALGSRLKSCRIHAHLNQTALAGHIGLSRASISNIENGRQPITLQTLWRIAQVLSVGLQDLVPDEGEIFKAERQPPIQSAGVQSWVRGFEKVFESKEVEKWVKGFETGSHGNP